MPLAGWVIKGQRYTFAEAEAEATAKGSLYRFPPAALAALHRSQRESKRLVISPSAAGGCARRHLLQLTEDYYENPENLWAAFVGSAVHKRLEVGGEYEEMHLSMPIEVPVIGVDGVITDERITLSGTLDHYDAEHRRLTDYKTTSRPFKMQIAGKWVYRELPEPNHVIQANLYRLLLEHHGYPVDSISIWYAQPGATARQVVSVPLWSVEDAYDTATAVGNPIAHASLTGVLPRCTCQWASKQEPDLCNTFTSQTWHHERLPPLNPGTDQASPDTPRQRPTPPPNRASVLSVTLICPCSISAK